MTSYDGVAITYDAMGNPLSYYNGNSYTFTWLGRQLATANYNEKTMSFTYNDEGIRTSKTVNGTTTTYYLSGSTIIGEQTGDAITVYIYDASGSPIGFQYRDAGYAIDAWDCFWYEKNLHGDIVAVYSNAGIKLVSYTYDAWGNFTVQYYNGGNNTVASENPFTYRGYYYDIDLNLYYLNSRYYDSVVCRWINPDAIMSGVNESLEGFNLFEYCFNNPVMFTDKAGNWPSWDEFWEGVDDFFTNMIDAWVDAFEIEVGFGIGIGKDVLNTVTAGISRDTYIGFDDGEFVAGNTITAEMSLFDSDLLCIGGTYNHRSEQGGNRVSLTAGPGDGPFDMLNYSETKRSSKFSTPLFSINSRGEIVLGTTLGAHFIFGGYISIGFNINEYFVRLFD